MPAPLPRQWRLWFGITTVGVLVVWAATALFVVPVLIRRAYAGESLALFNRIISGQDVHPVEYYLADFARLAWWATGGLIAAAGAAYAVLRFRRVLGHGAQEFARLFGAGAPRLSRREILIYAIAWGIVVGLAEALVMVIDHVALTRSGRSEASQEVVWMAPAAGVVAFGAIAGVLSAGRVWFTSLSTIRLETWFYGAVTTYTVIALTGGGVHWVAAALLAGGLGWQVAGLLTNHAQRLRAHLTAATLALAAVVVTAGIVHQASGWIAERRALAVSPVASSDAPNVLLIVLDTVRARSTSLYGYDRDTTPYLRSLASQGTTFDFALSTSSWTLQSHASLFTGLEPGRTSVDWGVPLDGSPRTLAEALTARGYATAGFMANLYVGTEFFGLGRGFLHWDDHPTTWNMILRSSLLTRRLVRQFDRLVGDHRELVRRPADDISGSFLRWLDGVDGRPFFAFLNYIDAHAPFGPGPDFTGEYSTAKDRYWFEPYFSGYSYAPGELGELQNSYDSAIRHLDASLERLLTELDRRGILDQTLVIVTADHGEEFGEHGPRVVEHANNLNVLTTHVPLFMRWPEQVPAGVRVPGPASLADIPATVAELVDLPDVFPGRSLAGRWDRPFDETASWARSELAPRPAARPWHAASKGYVRSVASGSLYYIQAGDAFEQLYDLSVDPRGLVDVADAPERRAAVAAMRELLNAPRPTGSAANPPPSASQARRVRR